MTAAAMAPHVWHRRPTDEIAPALGVAADLCLAARSHGAADADALAPCVHRQVSGMRRPFAVRDRESSVMRAAILAMAVVVLAVGFCVFDSHDHDGMDDHASVDLCLGMLAVSLPIVVTAGLPLTGSTSADRLAPVPEFSPHVPAPPPKRLSWARARRSPEGLDSSPGGASYAAAERAVPVRVRRG